MTIPRARTALKRVDDGRTDVGSTADLIARVRAGDHAALARCYREFAPSLLLLARRLTGEHADAEDVVQDVFVGLPEALRDYEERGMFNAWIRRVTARHALTRHRRERRRREVQHDDQSVAALGASGNGDFGPPLMVERALMSLSESSRQVFVLRVVEGHSHAEIARMLGITVGNSEVTLSRALKALRGLLGGSP